MEGGWYYLHTNRALIHKRFEPEPDSPFVCRVWQVDITNRMSAWTILIEAAALGASPERLKELGERWKCTKEDCLEMLKRLTPNEEQRKGTRCLSKIFWDLDFDRFLDVLENTPKGEEPDLSLLEGSSNGT